MREIKFRCFDKATNEMMFTGYHVIGEVTVFGGIDIWIHENPVENKDTFQRYSEIVEMQYTGLKDKNGKEIYEGDIVRVDEKVMLVQMLEGCWRTKYGNFTSYRLYGWVAGSLEVIGNIYETPELLKKLN